MALVGLPVTVDGKLYNCAAVVCHGKLLGLVPKTYLPNYGEFYERRQFNPAPAGVRTLHFAGQEVLFGTKLLFRCAEMPEFCLGVEVCEDLWAPLPPSTHHALAGATVIANLSASDETIGKADYRRALVSCAAHAIAVHVLYADAGHGRVDDRHGLPRDLIQKKRRRPFEAKPFGAGYACTELDLGRMVSERCRSTTFRLENTGYAAVAFHLPLREVPLTRPVSPTPFVPADDAAAAPSAASSSSPCRRTGWYARTPMRTQRPPSSHLRRAGQRLARFRKAVRAMQRPAARHRRAGCDDAGTTHRTRSNAEILCESWA